jgi:hypothetical protein
MCRSGSSRSGSTSNTVEPECSMMYATSSAFSRKFTGTSTRPNTLTPKSARRNRAAFGDTMATRSFSPTPRSSRAAARLLAFAANSEYVNRPSPPPGGFGSSTTASRAPYTSSARSRKSPSVSGTIMTWLLHRRVPGRRRRGRRVRG